jgi:hypothetical protein
LKNSSASRGLSRGRQEEEGFKMTRRAVRCPYCVLGYEFRPMQPKPALREV